LAPAVDNDHFYPGLNAGQRAAFGLIFFIGGENPSAAQDPFFRQHAASGIAMRQTQKLTCVNAALCASAIIAFCMPGINPETKESDD